MGSDALEGTVTGAGEARGGPGLGRLAVSSAVAPIRAALGLLGVAGAAWLLARLTVPEVFDYREDVVYLAGQHIELVAWAGGLAVATGVPCGILLSRPAARRVAEVLLQLFNIGTTVPTLAILALSMTVLGVGTPPAIFGLWLATLLPIVRNTYAGLRSVEPHLLEAARGSGMTNLQILRQVELPNALFVVLAGVRTALAICVGTAPLAFLIGAGGLGELIFTGIALNELPMMLAGAIPTALLAVAADSLVGALQFCVVPRGINPMR